MSLIYPLSLFSFIRSMPISSPPQTYNLDTDPAGTSGIPMGPDLLIADDNLSPLPANLAGNIFVRGPPCFGTILFYL